MTRLQHSNCQPHTNNNNNMTGPYTTLKLVRHDCDAAQVRPPSQPRHHRLRPATIAKKVWIEAEAGPMASEFWSCCQPRPALVLHILLCHSPPEVTLQQRDGPTYLMMT